MIFIPNRETKLLRQSNKSKILGTILSSFNLDIFSNLGTIKVSPRLRINTANITNQGRAVAFRNLDQRLWAICGTRIFKSTAELNDFNATFSEDSSTGVRTDYDPNYSDMEFFNNTLVAASVARISSKIADGSGTGAWTERYTLTSATSPHKMVYFTKYNRLYFIDDNRSIKSMDTSWSTATSGDYFIDIRPSTGGSPYALETDSNNIWIGTVVANESSTANMFRNASIFIWDGFSSTVTAEYPIKAQGILALRKDSAGVMHAIDTNGALLRFNGAGFTEIDRLPLDKDMLINATTGVYNAFIHPNGFIQGKNGRFLVLINNALENSGSSIKENMSSGIYEWSAETGFIHRQSPTMNTISNSNIVDYGQNRVSAVGALSQLDLANDSASGNPSLICGIDYYTNATASVSGIFIDDALDTIQKKGYFTTVWISSQALKDTWKKLAIKYRQLLDAADKITLKYRTTDAIAKEMTITWVSTTSFTTTSTDILGKEGYEVEVLQGTGAGNCVHITSIGTTSPYVVAVDEVVKGVSTDTAKIRVQNWTKHLSVEDQTTESTIKSILSNNHSERIQVKCCMRFSGENELHELIIVNGEHTKIE